MKVFILLLHAAVATAVLNETDIAEVNKFVNNNGVKIHYATYGSGRETLLFQHGFPDRETSWNTFQLPEFVTDYKVITPTLRGYPPSDIPPGHSNYTGALMVSDMAAILNNEGIDKVILIGHDVGGAIAQYFTYAFPERVTALVMANTPFVPTFLPLVEFDPGQQEMSQYTHKYYTYVAGQPKNISTIVAEIRNDTYRQQVTDYLQANDISGMLSFYNENYPAPPYGKPVNLDGLAQGVPSCIIWGSEEAYFSPKTLDGLDRWFTDGFRLVTIPRAGHWAFRDQPVRWNAELKSFLAFLKDYRFPVTLPPPPA